jgi:hypothetical protein
LVFQCFSSFIRKLTQFVPFATIQPQPLQVHDELTLQRRQQSFKGNCRLLVMPYES